MKNASSWLFYIVKYNATTTSHRKDYDYKSSYDTELQLCVVWMRNKTVTN